MVSLSSSTAPLGVKPAVKTEPASVATSSIRFSAAVQSQDSFQRMRFSGESAPTQALQPVKIDREALISNLLRINQESGDSKTFYTGFKQALLPMLADLERRKAEVDAKLQVELKQLSERYQPRLDEIEAALEALKLEKKELEKQLGKLRNEGKPVLKMREALQKKLGDTSLEDAAASADGTGTDPDADEAAFLQEWWDDLLQDEQTLMSEIDTVLEKGKALQEERAGIFQKEKDANHRAGAAKNQIDNDLRIVFRSLWEETPYLNPEQAAADEAELESRYREIDLDLAESLTRLQDEAKARHEEMNRQQESVRQREDDLLIRRAQIYDDAARKAEAIRARVQREHRLEKQLRAVEREKNEKLKPTVEEAQKLANEAREIRSQWRKAVTEFNKRHKSLHARAEAEKAEAVRQMNASNAPRLESGQLDLVERLSETSMRLAADDTLGNAEKQVGTQLQEGIRLWLQHKLIRAHVYSINASDYCPYQDKDSPYYLSKQGMTLFREISKRIQTGPRPAGALAKAPEITIPDAQALDDLMESKKIEPRMYEAALEPADVRDDMQHPLGYALARAILTEPQQDYREWALFDYAVLRKEFKREFPDAKAKTGFNWPDDAGSQSANPKSTDKQYRLPLIMGMPKP